MAAETNHQLITAGGITGTLAEAKSLEDIKAVRDKAEAVRTYARTARVGLEVQNQAAELKLRAERKAGHLLASLSLRGGDRRSNRAERRAKLEDLGISRDESRRWQLLATIPEKVFDKYVTNATKLGEEIAAAPLLKLARKLKKPGGASKPIRRAPTNGKVHSPALEWSRHTLASAEMLDELAHHCSVLVGLVAPTSFSDELNLSAGQVRHVRRLLGEMATLLETIRAN